MAVNWSTQLYAPQYTQYARPVTFTPTIGASFGGRGIYNTVAMDVIGEDQTIISDTRTILDVLDSDFSVVPVQGDRLTIPAHIGMPALGEFEVIDTSANGAGETTLVLRKWMAASIP